MSFSPVWLVCYRQFHTMYLVHQVDRQWYHYVLDIIYIYYKIMACVCSRYTCNVCSDWPIVGHLFILSLMPMGWLRARKTKAKSHIRKKLINLYRKISKKTWSCRVDVAITWSVGQGLSLRFSHKVASTDPLNNWILEIATFH